MAHCHNHTILIKAAIDFISLHFDMLSKDDDILHLDMREFTNILSSNTLMVSSELTVYALARRWWEFHSSTDNPLPEELLKFIRFSLMSSHELKELKEDVTSKVPSIQHLTSFHLRQGMYEDRIVCMDLQEREHLELKDTDFPLDSYDPGSGEWKKLPSLKSLLCPGCVALGNLLYVTGGIHQDDSVSSTLHVYDSVWNDWTELSSMAGPRSMHGFLAYNHKLYAVGGWDGTVVIDSAESYNVLDKCWNRISNLPLPLRMFSSTELNGKLYLIGGETGGIYPVPVYQGILIYNTLTDIWSQFSFNIVSRSAGAVTLGNKIFVVGGYTTQTSDSNEAMPMLKATSKCFCMGDMGEVYSDCLVPPLPFKIASAGVVVWKQRIYVLGGEDREYFSDKMYYWTPGDSAWTRCTEKLPILYDGVSDFGCITMQIPLKHIKSCIPSRRLLNQ
ncbi:kelch-like protein 7 [Discoglossus pictus]